MNFGNNERQFESQKLKFYFWSILTNNSVTWIWSKNITYKVSFCEKVQRECGQIIYMNGEKALDH